MAASTNNPSTNLFVPPLGSLYAALNTTSETILRAVAGIFLTIHGSGKIFDPLGAAEMVEGLGFYPGTFWSVLLACTEFFGGIFIAIGLLTRPAAFAGMFVLLVTVWFHWVTLGEGFSGAEKSLLWAAILFFFVIRGANRQSVDARIGKAF
ncbi:DoxX family protein [Mesorhizobium sp.]|uniref:DoxX family protein n=1 Tax=Mesorhizobium sp. TaxID=1871066 RepID=UPI000FE2C6F7|nr:DoxX family protein [Mesorhizobium sp.]RWC03672.1 MAG: DoxX family protein [Mesorhizobium sp.]RWQ20350.1 MAG: DoxX family protein [Mesorhizobium sp.]